MEEAMSNDRSNGMVPANSDASTEERQELSLDDFVEHATAEHEEAVFDANDAMPTILNDRDVLGKHRSPRVRFQVWEQGYRSQEPELLIQIQVADGEYLSSGEAFLKEVDRFDTAGARSGIDDGFRRRLENQYWKQNRGMRRGGDFLKIPGLAEGQQAYETAVLGYEALKYHSRGKGAKEDKALGRTQYLSIPLSLLQKALTETDRSHYMGRIGVQALNLREEDTDFPAARLIISFEPQWKRGAGTDKRACPENGIFKKGIMILLDDPRFSHLAKQGAMYMKRKVLDLRANTNYPFTPKMDSQERADAVARFRNGFWSLARFFNNSGTPLNGPELVMFVASSPEMFTIEHLEAVFAECKRILTDPTSTPKKQDAARLLWDNLQRMCRSISAFIGRLDAQHAVKQASATKQLEAPPPPVEAGDQPKSDLEQVTTATA